NYHSYINKIENENDTIRLPNNNLDNHTEKLIEKIISLHDFLNVKELIIISHLKLDFFGNLEHDFPKVINDYKKLSEYLPNKSFKEAIELDKSEIGNFVEIFFWLERCDPSIPEYVFWFDKNEKFCFYLCKYVNIHFIDLTKGNLITENELKNLGFDLDDEDQFEQNAIDRRQIKV